MKKTITVLLLVFLAAFAIYNNLHSKSGSTEQIPKAGFTAPYFSLKAMDNNTYNVAGKRERPVILNFWASWCGPCRQEAPDLRQVYLKYQDKIDFYAINLTSNDVLDEAKAFVGTFQLPFPILLDETGKVADSYQIMSIPTTYFVDSNGIIRQKVIGATDRGSFEKYVRELIK